MKKILLLGLVFLAACGGANTPATQSVALPKIQLPDVPTMINEKETPDWMAIHFWDLMNPADTSFKVYPAEFEQVMQMWEMIVQKASYRAKNKAVKSFFKRVEGDSAEVSRLLEVVEKTFYNPYKPKRDFEAYIAALEFVDGYDKFSDLDKMRPRAQLKMALQNRVGSIANNFEFMTLDNNKYKLHDVFGPYTLIFINNPGCPICQEYKDILTQNEPFAKMVECNALQVIGIVPDDDEKGWREKAAQFPKNWVNGFNYTLNMKKDQTYDLSIVPSILLLDRDKRVVLKDPTPDELLEFIYYL